MSDHDPAAELVELDMQQPGHGRVLLSERSGEVVWLSADWWTTEADPHAGDLTRLTVNLIPQARSALHDAADATGDTMTEVVNRALQLYRELVTSSPGDSITWHHGDVERTVTVARDVETIHPAGEVL